MSGDQLLVRVIDSNKKAKDGKVVIMAMVKLGRCTNKSRFLNPLLSPTSILISSLYMPILTFLWSLNSNWFFATE